MQKAAVMDAVLGSVETAVDRTDKELTRSAKNDAVGVERVGENVF